MFCTTCINAKGYASFEKNCWHLIDLSIKIRDMRDYWTRATSFSMTDQEIILKEGD